MGAQDYQSLYKQEKLNRRIFQVIAIINMTCLLYASLSTDIHSSEMNQLLKQDYIVTNIKQNSKGTKITAENKYGQEIYFNSNEIYKYGDTIKFEVKKN